MEELKRTRRVMLVLGLVNLLLFASLVNLTYFGGNSLAFRIVYLLGATVAFLLNQGVLVRAYSEYRELKFRLFFPKSIVIHDNVDGEGVAAIVETNGGELFSIPIPDDVTEPDEMISYAFQSVVPLDVLQKRGVYDIEG